MCNEIQRATFCSFQYLWLLHSCQSLARPLIILLSSSRDIVPKMTSHSLSQAASLSLSWSRHQIMVCPCPLHCVPGVTTRLAAILLHQTPLGNYHHRHF